MSDDAIDIKEKDVQILLQEDENGVFVDVNGKVFTSQCERREDAIRDVMAQAIEHVLRVVIK